MASFRLARVAAVAAVVALAAVLAGCSFSFYVGPAPDDSTPAPAASKTLRPDEICDTGLLEVQGLQVCIQNPLENAGGATVAVGIVNPRSDAAALIKPTYRTVRADGSATATQPMSMIGSASGILALPGNSWARDSLEVAADTAKTTVELQVTWLPGKGKYAPYTRLQYRKGCGQTRPFTGCTELNHNAYDISVRLVVAFQSHKSDGSWVVEKVMMSQSDVVLPAGGADTVVPASAAQIDAVTEWLLADETNTFSVDVESSTTQPEFPQP